MASKSLANLFMMDIHRAGEVLPRGDLACRDPCASDGDRKGTSSDLVSERERDNESCRNHKGTSPESQSRHCLIIAGYSLREREYREAVERDNLKRKREKAGKKQ
ncbi:hypothetical protein L484_022130 [Morus notabilis]|uniref:Uncharacterized protein n=1 Tax=Morus notabilis TaxID=981085 RepID=W9QND1_9ROSA|nr:hypothetical protein L484_022130 [Morus notabilis]